MRRVLRDLDLVVTVDASDRVLRGQDVVIEDGVIIEVTDACAGGDRRWGSDAELIDGRGRLVMPGLVNLHTHLPMTLLRGLAEHVDLQGLPGDRVGR